MNVVQFPDTLPMQNEQLITLLCDIIDNEGAVIPLSVIIADLEHLAGAYRELQDKPRKSGKIIKFRH